MKNYWNAFRALNRDVRLYLAFWSVVGFAYFGVQGVILNLYLLRLGYGPEFIGMAWGLGQLVWAVFALPAGAVGARVGVKQAMLAGMLILGLGGGLGPLAEFLPEPLRAGGFLGAWMLSWVGASLSAVNAAPFLMAVTDDRSRGFAFSAQQAAMGLAGFAGSLVGGLLPGIAGGLLGRSLEDPAPYRTALLVVPLVYLAGAVVFSRAGSPAAVAGQPGAARGANRFPLGLVAFFGVLIFLQAFGEGTVRAFFNVYMDADLGMAPGAIGAVFGAAQLLMIFVALGVPALMERWGAGATLAAATYGVALAVFGLSRSASPVLASAVYMAISGLLVIVATGRGIYSQVTVHARWRTLMSAVATIGLALGWSSAAWVGGRVAEVVGLPGVFLIGSALALASAGMLTAYRPRVVGPEDLPEAENSPVRSAAREPVSVPVTGNPAVAAAAADCADPGPA